ncbi:MAG: HlyD family secretion protein [Acetobacteraceae bacterium]|nr:HlyD family secretion protein [Acetobacteraceae bacterium]
MRITRPIRVAMVVCGVLGAFGLYELVTSFVAYTSDAYVRSDLVAIAPEVTGRITEVHVTDNQTVARGDLLATIDPVPFQLIVAQRQAEIDEAAAQLSVDADALKIAQDQLASAQSAVTFAQETQSRMSSLTATGDVARQQLDQANDALRRAEAGQSSAQGVIDRVRATTSLHQAARAQAEAAMATAQWELSRTRLIAPTDGSINNLTVRVGDTAQIDVPLIGIVDAHAFRIIANYKQDYIRNFTIGQTAWIWLDSDPWRFHRGHIAGIAQGISRDPTPNGLLPYVAPTTDWIRLQRRFPVTILLDDLPPGFRLYMGADARSTIFP